VKCVLMKILSGLTFATFIYEELLWQLSLHWPFICKFYLTCFILLPSQFIFSVFCSRFPSHLRIQINETKSLSVMSRKHPYTAPTYLCDTLNSPVWQPAVFTLFQYLLSSSSGAANAVDLYGRHGFKWF